MRTSAFSRPCGGAARRTRAMILGGIAAVAFIGACDGDNLFDSDFEPGGGTGESSAPQVVIVQPQPDAQYHRADSVFVEVQVSDEGGVSSVNLVGLAFTGDPELGTDEVVTRYAQKSVALDALPADTTLRRYLNPTNSPDTTSQVGIVVDAYDPDGNVGSDTVWIRTAGGPDVDILLPPAGDTLVAGFDESIRITASDDDGIAAVYIVASGVVEDTLHFPPFSDNQSSVTLDTIIPLPIESGTLTLQAFAVNGLGATGQSPALTYEVEIPTGPDEEPPSLKLDVTGQDRMELGDEIEIHVSAVDEGASGLASVGVTALAMNTTRTDTLAIDTVFTFAAPREDADLTFGFKPFNVDSLALPDTMVFEVHAFAVDGEGQMACAVATTYQQLGCEERAYPAGGTETFTVATGAAGQLFETVVVAGRTVLLPDGGRIADAAVDTVRERLYLSNVSASKVDVLDMAANSFLEGVYVGSKPWGIALNRTEDTLIVANSGGTNLSFVPLDGVPLEEDGARRLRTPNVVLFQIKETKDEFGARAYEYVGRNGDDFISFSDRPQFVAQDSTGLILYSTVPTGSTAEGTLRFVDADPDPATLLDTPEAKLLFNGKAVESSTDDMVIAHVDSLLILDAVDDLLVIWDHKYGFPDSVIVGGPADRATAVNQLRAQGSDVFAQLGAWNLEEIGMSDTTFLATSGDRGWIAFGDGATVPFAQIIMWRAATRSISSDIDVSDLIENAAERVRGLGLSGNGSLGVAKGANGVYFFDTSLRQQGEITGAIVAGGSGAVLHPAHPDYATLTQSTDSTLAFVGTGRRSIKIVDTWNVSRERGEILIRDNIVGPLRATLPLPGDLSDPACTSDPTQCVVVKLYGVTDAGGVVIVDVRKRDIES